MKANELDMSALRMMKETCVNLTTNVTNQSLSHSLPKFLKRMDGIGV